MKAFRLGAVKRLTEQGGLADTRLAFEEQHGQAVAPRRQQLIDCGEFLLAADELGTVGSGPSVGSQCTSFRRGAGGQDTRTDGTDASRVSGRFGGSRIGSSS